MIITLTSWVLLLIGLTLFSWFFWIRSRGSLRYWIREYESEKQWALGQIFPAAEIAKRTPQFFTDANAVVRSLDRRTTKVVRQWDRDSGTLFLGLILSQLPEGPMPDDYELRELPAQRVIRLSGNNRLDETTPNAAIHEFAKARGLDLDFKHPARLSGQSFSLYQWKVIDGPETTPPSQFERWAETTNQLRNNLVLPLMATLLALALIGTGKTLLFMLGIGLITFLSGACKFVFMHQMTDEADEIHLQNY